MTWKIIVKSRDCVLLPRKLLIEIQENGHALFRRIYIPGIDYYLKFIFWSIAEGLLNPGNKTWVKVSSIKTALFPVRKQNNVLNQLFSIFNLNRRFRYWNKF